MEREIKDNLTIIMIQVELLESKEVTDEELERIAAAVRRCATAAEGVM